MTMRFIEGETGVGQFLNDPDRARAGLARILCTAARAWREAYGDFSPSDEVKEQARKIDLRQQTLEFLSGNAFREPTAQEREILKLRGYDIVLSTSAKTLYSVVVENPDHFWGNELKYVNAKSQLRDYTPPALTVALRSQELFLTGSFSKPQSVQLRMMKTESLDVQKLIPAIPAARAIMLPASTIAQLDLRFLEETGQVLFKDGFARALDETSDVHVADVGRRHPGAQLCVRGWNRGLGYDLVGALSAVVFIQK